MAVVAVIGAQWGDEGKGKIVDELSMNADFVVRYQGGSNAGHRVVHEKGEFVFRLVPSGILYPNTTCIIGNGVVVDPKGLLAEMEELDRLGIDTSRLYISERAHVVMPYHFLLDRLEESARGADKIDSTQRGIGPAYVDKHARIGIRMADLLDADTLRSKLSSILQQKNRMITQIYSQPPLSLEEIHGEYFGYGQRLRSHIADTQAKLHDALFEHKTILLEGAQGALLDIDFGTYPFVTSSSTMAANAASGAGLPPRSIDRVVGVYKAYITSSLVKSMQYYKDPEKTQSSRRGDYMTVGDMGYLDADGYLYIVDRKTDMVISGGVNIYPAEIEEVIHEHPAVIDVAVIGVPNEEWGEELKAVVQLKDGARATADDIIDFCRERLADYKRPRSVDFVAEVPRNPSGKLLKREIRAPYWEGRTRRV